MIFNPWEAWWEENWSITPKIVILFLFSLLRGILVFPWGRVQARQYLGGQDPCTSSCTPGMLQETWRAAPLSHFFTCCICHHLSHHTPSPLTPNHTVSKGLEGWWSTENIFGLCWPAASGGQHLLSPSLEKRAALILAVSHPLDNHFSGRSSSEAEDTQDYISQWEQPCKKNMSQGTLCRRPGLCCQLFSYDLCWHLMPLLETAATGSMLPHEKSVTALSSLNLSWNWTCEQEPAAATTNLGIF